MSTMYGFDMIRKMKQDTKPKKNTLIAGASPSYVSDVLAGDIEDSNQ